MVMRSEKISSGMINNCLRFSAPYMWKRRFIDILQICFPVRFLFAQVSDIRTLFKYSFISFVLENDGQFFKGFDM